MFDHQFPIKMAILVDVSCSDITMYVLPLVSRRSSRGRTPWPLIPSDSRFFFHLAEDRRSRNDRDMATSPQQKLLAQSEFEW